MKKITALLLAALLLMGTVSTVLAASVSQEYSATTVQAGETVTVTLTLDEAIENVTNFDYRIYFDTDLFELTSSSNGTAHSAMQISNLMYGGHYRITYVDTTSTGQTISAGTLYTLVFKAKEDITDATNAVFRLEYEDISDSSFNTITVPVTNEEVTISVSPKSEVTAGYTVTMPTDVEVTGYQFVYLPVTVGHTDEGVTTFNAVDMTFSYDKTLLELTTLALDGFTLTNDNGTIRIQGYGDDRELGKAFTLCFQTLNAGTSAVTVTSAKVDISANAISADALEASKIDSATNITVNAYEVTLPDDFEGEGTARPGESYTFTAKDLFYIYEISATMGSTSVAVIDNGNGKYTIDNVSGNIVITTTKKTPMTFDVTINGEDLTADVTGENAATYMTDYVATLTPIDGFKYEVTVTIAGEAYTGYTTMDNVYTIPGADIRGDIVFTVVKTQNDGVTVTVNGPSGEVVGEPSVIIGTDYKFTVNKQEGYEYDITATMDGESVEIIDNGDGTYTIEDVTGPIVITVTKTLTATVITQKYVNTDGRTIFLVLANGGLANGYTYAYEGQVMYYSNQYNSYAYLTFVETTFTDEDAKAKVSVVQGTSTTYAQTFDVNGTGLVDINDAQLTYDMYNMKYEDFSTVNMQKFLNADVNGDKLVDTEDAAAIVNEIQ